MQVLVLRLRDSVVRLGEELEQSAQAEARERENARYYQQRLQDTRLEMEELIQREQDSSRRRMELVTNLRPQQSYRTIHNSRCCGCCCHRFCLVTSINVVTCTQIHKHQLQIIQWGF